MSVILQVVGLMHSINKLPLSETRAQDGSSCRDTVTSHYAMEYTLCTREHSSDTHMHLFLQWPVEAIQATEQGRAHPSPSASE